MRAPLLIAILLAACGGSSNNNNDTPDAGYDCTMETRADTFSAGMMKIGSQGQVTFKLMSSTPAPPSRGDNTWQLDLVDGSGHPIAGAAVTATPFMPDHNHGTSIKAVVTEPSAGHYSIAPVNLWMPGLWQVTIKATPVNLWMPGLWQVTLKATPAGGTADTAVFSFCISS